MEGRASGDAEAFVNRVGYWEYRGKYSVELAPHTDLSIVPACALVTDDTVHVYQGVAQFVHGGIQFFARGEAFFWGWDRIKSVRDGSGSLLWINDAYR